MAKLDDDSLMPWGKHKGLLMAEVPDSYLLWLYQEKRAKGNVLDYIEDNLDAILANLGKTFKDLEDHE